MAAQSDALGTKTRRWEGILALLALAAIAGLFLAAPGSLLDRADRAAYAVCHRLPLHSIFIAGRQLPLCARCSGTYLGALAGFAGLALAGRGRASLLPPRRYLLILALFVAAWAFDGANSYLTLFPGAPHLYEPQNFLRLTTGALEGVALAAILLPVLNLVFQPVPAALPSVGSWRDLGWLLVAAGLVVALVASAAAPLLYPLAMLSGLAVVLLVSMVNAIAVLTFFRLGTAAHAWRRRAAACLVGLALGMGELTAIALVRDALTSRLGLPF